MLAFKILMTSILASTLVMSGNEPAQGGSTGLYPDAKAALGGPLFFITHSDSWLQLAGGDVCNFVGDALHHGATIRSLPAFIVDRTKVIVMTVVYQRKTTSVTFTTILPQSTMPGEDFALQGGVSNMNERPFLYRPASHYCTIF